MGPTTTEFADAVLAAQKHGRGWVTLFADQVADTPGFERPQTANAREAVLVADVRGEVLPGVLLEDDSVLALSWAQAAALSHFFDNWRDRIVAAQRTGAPMRATPEAMPL